MIYPNKPLYLLSLLGYVYYLTYYTLTTKDNIFSLLSSPNTSEQAQCIFLVAITKNLCIQRYRDFPYQTPIKSRIFTLRLPFARR